MPDVRKSYVHWNGHDHGVSWHPISGQVFVYWGTWKLAGTAGSMQRALDQALGWLSSHAR